MAKKHNWHSSHVGSTAEKAIMDSLNHFGIRYTKEKVANSKAQGKTNHGEFDFRLHFSKYDHCIECKTTSTKITIPNGTNKNPNVKSAQLRCLREALLDGHKSGLILNFRTTPEQWYYMSIKQFDNLIYNEYPINAITAVKAEKYGTRINVSESGKLLLKPILRG